MKKLKWVIAHEPYEIFIKPAQEFSKYIFENTNGEYSVEVLSLSEWNEKYNTEEPISALDTSHRGRVIKLVESGEMEISQLYANSLGEIDKDMYVLSLPFLFDNHTHAESVLDGTVGAGIMDGVRQKSNLKPLAFTYSGGFRVLPSNHNINSFEDLADLRVRCGNSPVAKDTFKKVNAKPVYMPIETLAHAFSQDQVDAGETTYPRYYTLKHNQNTSVINHTEHSLFLTTIVMNLNFWNSLDSKTQAVFQEAALRSAGIERRDALDDILDVQNRAMKDGKTVNILSDKEKSRFKDKTQELFAEYDSYFTKGLIKKILTAG